MNNTYLYRFMGLLAILWGLQGCKKFVQVSPPINQEISKVVFSNDQNATAAVLGIYSKIMGSNEQFLNGAYSLYSGLSADELASANPPNSSADPFYANALTANGPAIQGSFWTPAYNTVHQVNLCIEGITGATAINSAVKQQLLGETHFMRALCYFYLVNTFGDVPLVTSSDYTVSQSEPRTPSTEVYNQITADLHTAIGMLSAEYPGEEPVRANKWAAVALLARVYLYQKNWDGADSAATAVIESGKYQLVDNLDEVFLGASTEAILQFQPNQDAFNTSEGNSFLSLGNSTIPNYAVTNWLINAFETGDARKTAWLTPISVDADTFIVPYKYKIGTESGSPKTEYNMVLRLAEQYLIRAEARAESNNVGGAADDINTIRRRAKLGDTPAGDQPSLIKAVMAERRIELLAEWGHRWFDLKRTGQTGTVLSAEKTGWSDDDALYPIPFAEIQLNPFLKQNHGY